MKEQRQITGQKNDGHGEGLRIPKGSYIALLGTFIALFVLTLCGVFESNQTKEFINQVEEGKWYELGNGGNWELHEYKKFTGDSRMYYFQNYHTPYSDLRIKRKSYFYSEIEGFIDFCDETSKVEVRFFENGDCELIKGKLTDQTPEEFVNEEKREWLRSLWEPAWEE